MWSTPFLDLGKADAVGSDRRISSNIFADVWVVDRLREGIGFSHV